MKLIAFVRSIHPPKSATSALAELSVALRRALGLSGA